MLTPAQVAKRANVSVQSIRNWTKDYADLLSPAARGETGTRLFDDEDVDTLCAIAALRKSGVPPAEVAERVRNHTHPTVIDVAPQSTPQQPTETLQTAQDAPLALYALQSSLQSRLEALERRVDAGTNQLVTGIVIGAAIVLVVVALVLRVV